ncbi:J domain-containing protein [Kitasatospora sp. NPDC051914]|uniref:J domain-containing protein n=1 Tax=Kitasatospora sp. NPDC051914 TaxID=3154945 RepID=UPI0034209CE1
MATTGSRDYYDILGVPHDADRETVKRAFHDLARKYHPDLSTRSDAQERFKEVAEAYAVLSDPDRRADYDHHGATPPAGISVEDLLAGLDLGEVFGRTGGASFGRPGGMFGGPLAGGMFGNPFGGRATRPPERGADVELELTVPLSAVLTGSTGTVTVRRPAACPVCGGAGGVFHEPCTACAGSGRVVLGEPVTFRIPPGIGEGTVFRLPGRGMPPPEGRGASGDVFVAVRTAPDPRFTRQGADLWCGIEIPVHDAVLGTRRTVPALDGDVRLVVPPGTQPGAVLGVPGRGLPRPDGGTRGDLRVSVTVRIPDRPGEEEQDLYRRLAELRAAHGKAGAGQSPAHAGDEPPEPRTKAAGAPEVGRARWWRRRPKREAR